VNQDGEVESFSCLTPADVLAALRHNIWTHDAASAMALAWISPPAGALIPPIRESFSRK
jgi:hypothetical protein